MNTVICSVPTEAPGTKLIRERWEEDGGVGGVRPKIAITSLNHWAVTNGFDDCKFYDIDMLLENFAAILSLSRLESGAVARSSIEVDIALAIATRGDLLFDIHGHLVFR